MASKAEIQNFINEIGPIADTVGAEYGIDPAVIVTQAAHESAYGTAAPGHNYFGVKGRGQTFATTEQGANGLYNTTGSFRVYPSMEASVRGWADLVSNRFPGVVGAAPSDAFAALKAGGYASDAKYVPKLNGVLATLNDNGLGHPVPPASIPGIPGLADLSAFAGGSNNSALNAISNISGSPDTRSSPGLAPAQPFSVPPFNPFTQSDALGLAPITAPDATPALNLPNPNYPRMDAGFNPATGLVQPYDTAAVRANMLPPAISTNAPGQVGQSPIQASGFGSSSPAGGAVGGGSATLPSSSPPSTFPARPGLVASNGTAPRTANYGAPANPVSVPPYTPGKSVADTSLLDAIYPNGQPTYASQGSLPDVPNWARPSVPVSVQGPTAGMPRSSGPGLQEPTNVATDLIARGFDKGTNQALASPGAASGINSAFGGLGSFLGNLPPMSSGNGGVSTGKSGETGNYHAPPVSQTPVGAYLPSKLWSDPSGMKAASGVSGKPDNYDRPGYMMPAELGVPNYPMPSSSSTNYGAPGYSGNSSYGPSSYLPPASIVNFPGGDVYGNVGSSAVAMNDRSGAGNTHAAPRTTTQQVLNPAYTQWQHTQAQPSDSIYGGTDTGLSWAGLNTDDASNPFSSFASPANIPAPPPKYITRTVVNPDYEPPLAYPTGGNPVAGAFNHTHIGGLLSFLGGGQNASDMLFGGGSTGVNRGGPQVPPLLSLGLTPQQRSASTPEYLAAVNAGQKGYTPAGSNMLMPTTTVNGGYRQNYGDSGSGSLSSRG